MNSLSSTGQSNNADEGQKTSAPSAVIGVDLSLSCGARTSVRGQERRASGGLYGDDEFLDSGGHGDGESSSGKDIVKFTVGLGVPAVEGGVGREAIDECDGSSSSSRTYRPKISRNNIGYQLLKKAGWSEGEGLGLHSQGRLAPVSAHLKSDKGGIGADKVPNVRMQDQVQEQRKIRKREIAADPTDAKLAGNMLSKKERRRQYEAERARDHELAHFLYREFMPDNV